MEDYDKLKQQKNDILERRKLSKRGKVQILVEEMLKEPNQYANYEDWIASVEYYRNKIMDIFDVEE